LARLRTPQFVSCQSRSYWCVQEGQDLDDTVWNVSMAAGVCLGLVALTVRDEILPLVIQPFVQVSNHPGATALAADC
jgi:hypothetical protein